MADRGEGDLRRKDYHNPQRTQEEEAKHQISKRCEP